jgi:general nucleoside transport system ATP-binding protein
MAFVEMRGITKRFPGVVANDCVDLDLDLGEIHGLLGENGAGKTTLMNILFGLYQQDAGEIKIDGVEVTIDSPSDAIALGIGMVHQHFKLVSPFTVTENIILGMKGRALLDLGAADRQVADLARAYGLNVDSTKRIQQLSVGEQQRVEILNSLYRGAKVLILDEPTAVLTPQEVEALTVTLKEIVNQGKAIVFITHKLDEVTRITDRVTILRNGQIVYQAMTKETNKNELARQMIGRELSAMQSSDKKEYLTLAGASSEKLTIDQAKVIDTTRQPLLDIANLHVKDDRGTPTVQGLSLKVFPGEILGIAGVDGNGQKELVEAIVRLRDIEQGRLCIMEEQANNWTVRDFLKHKTAYITDDRHREGLLLEFSIGENATLRSFDQPPFSKKGLLDFSAMIEFAGNLIKDYDIRAPGPKVQVGKLSGGNQQKLILARELSSSPELIIANKPTRGLDIGASAYIHKLLLAERQRGAGVLLVSADLDEILLLSDRILVMFNGRSTGEITIQDANPQMLGLLMGGLNLEDIDQEEMPE